VLAEKLGDLYETEGQYNLAVKAYRKALALNPTPQQRVRLVVDLAAAK
jgi:tetratricopeptide (TPR) repeat protein